MKKANVWATLASVAVSDVVQYAYSAMRQRSERPGRQNADRST
jgi:hypothetical protein